MVDVASFPGPAQLFVACSTETWVTLHPRFCTTTGQGLGTIEAMVDGSHRLNFVAMDTLQLLSGTSVPVAGLAPTYAQGIHRTMQVVPDVQDQSTVHGNLVRSTGNTQVME